MTKNDVNVIDKIVAEAKREDAELFREKKGQIALAKSKFNGGELIENTLVSPKTYLHIVDLRELPVSYNEFVSFDPNIHATQGFYQLVYLSKLDKRYKEGKPFVIGQDLLHIRVNISGPKHWRCLAERVPELGWIYRNSTLTTELFGIAKKHPGVPFIFTVKWVEYADKITEKAKKQGIDIDNKPFVSYSCSKERFEKEFKHKKLCDKKGYFDYHKEIKEADEYARSIHEEV